MMELDVVDPFFWALCFLTGMAAGCFYATGSPLFLVVFAVTALAALDAWRWRL